MFWPFKRTSPKPKRSLYEPLLRSVFVRFPSDEIVEFRASGFKVRPCGSLDIVVVIPGSLFSAGPVVITLRTFAPGAWKEVIHGE